MKKVSINTANISQDILNENEQFSTRKHLSAPLATLELYELETEFKLSFIKDYGQSSYENWFKRIKFISLVNDEFTISAPNEFVKNWIHNNYHNYIKQFIESRYSLTSLHIFINCTTGILAAVDSDGKKNNGNDIKFLSKNHNLTQEKDELTQSLAVQNIDKYPVNKNFVFENYVVGKFNKMAFDIANHIASGDKLYNNLTPFYLYGNIGMGKTHLICAIANKIKQKQPDKKVIYFSSERFIFEFVRAMNSKNIIPFKDEIRSADYLIVDDIHFLCGKMNVQSEFLHTINHILDKGGKLIIAGDRHPLKLEKLDEKIKSRLLSGINAEIGNIDYRFKQDFIREKSKISNVAQNPEKENKFLVSEPVIEFLCDNLNLSIRELEGVINRLVTFANLSQQEITAEYCKNILSEYFGDISIKNDINTIQKRVCELYNIELSQMLSSSRIQKIAKSRQIAMYLCKIHTSSSLKEIAVKFGNKNHATVIHSCKKIEQEMARNDIFRKEVEGILQK